MGNEGGRESEHVAQAPGMAAERGVAESVAQGTCLTCEQGTEKASLSPHLAGHCNIYLHFVGGHDGLARAVDHLRGRVNTTQGLAISHEVVKIEVATQSEKTRSYEYRR